jgi:hypothetical protein
MLKQVPHREQCGAETRHAVEQLVPKPSWRWKQGRSPSDSEEERPTAVVLSSGSRW